LFHVKPDTDSIAAIATPLGRGGVGVVRISGQRLLGMAEALAGRVPRPRHAELVTFRSASGEAIDQGLLLYFPGPASYTGEDVIELQGHGGPAVMARLLKRSLELGCRPARPGEFTQRVFLNDKIDLAQAESVADLIDAQSEQAAASAARTLTGEFSRRVHELTDALIELRMHVEACIDFPEEEIDPADRTRQRIKLQEIRALQAKLASEAKQGAVLREGLTVVLVGRPNVGKSSLLNRLAGDDVAIVTPIAGTTRDHVRATIHLDGVPIHLIDTAGLRETKDPIEKIGIERTWIAIQQAGAALLITESGETAAASDAELLDRLPPTQKIARVVNKVDLRPASDVSRGTSGAHQQAVFAVSALTGEGIDALRGWLLEAAGWHPGEEGVFLARERHLLALRQAAAHLDAAERVNGQFELFAEELRLAQHALAMITGEFSADDLLGEIFSRFCIGK
jgi:tRNA modification GTPase